MFRDRSTQFEVYDPVIVVPLSLTLPFKSYEDAGIHLQLEVNSHSRSIPSLHRYPSARRAGTVAERS